MTRIIRFFILASIFVVPITSAQDNPEQAAIDAMGEFITAWNTGSKAELGKTLNYPNFTLFGPGQLNIANDADAFSVDFDQLRDREDWRRSTFEDFRTSAVTANQVHLSCTYSRINSKDEVYRSGRVFYIVSKQDGHWGMQLRSGLSAGAPNAAAETAARETINAFFSAWNSEDNDATNKVMNFPHAFLIRGGRAAIANSAEQQQTNFEAMRKREEWDKSEYKDLDIFYAAPDKVLANLTFTRHKANGEIYATVPVLWIFTNQDGHWGIQFRAILGDV